MGRKGRRRRTKKVTSSSNVNVDDDEGICGVSPPSSPAQPTQELNDLIWRKKWSEASRRCRNHPQDARWKDPRGCLPIHRACFQGAPPFLIRLLHEAYREGITTTINLGQLPLHYTCACQSVSLKRIKYLLSKYPDGATKKDKYGDTPIDRINYSPILSQERKAKALAILSSPPSPHTPSPQKQPTKRIPNENATTTSTVMSIATTTSTTEAKATTTASSGSPRSLSAATSMRPSTLKPSDGGVIEGTVIHEDKDEIGELSRRVDDAVAAYVRAKKDAERLEAEAAAANDASEEARVLAEGLEAAEAEAGAAACVARRAWDEAARKHAVATEAARFGRRKEDVTDWNQGETMPGDERESNDDDNDDDESTDLDSATVK